MADGSKPADRTAIASGRNRAMAPIAELATSGKVSRPNIIWEPQVGPQRLMCACPVEEILFGGQAGGGKSDGLIGDYSSGIETYGAGWQGILFRRTSPELEEIIKRCLEIFGPVYGERCWLPSKSQWKFPTGAVLKLKFLDKDQDIMKYQGHQYAWIGFDELGHWPTDYCYTFMFSRARSPSGAPVQFRATANPGGPGHTWLRKRFMLDDDGKKIFPGTVITWVDEEGKSHDRIFIPSRLEDNKILMERDPGYQYRLNMISDPVLRRAMKYGDWDIHGGQAFAEFNRDIHVCHNHDVPADARMWRAMDWGYEKPFCVLWFYANHKGEKYVCNELYGSDPMGKDDVGSKTSAIEIRGMIENLEGSLGWYVPRGYLDAQCWESRDDVPSTYTRLGGAKLGWEKWPKGPGSRKIQKEHVHDALRIVNGKPNIYIFERCRNLIRTMPLLRCDPHDREDVDTTCEDHAYDTLRGGLQHAIITAKDRENYRAASQRRRRRRKQHQPRFGGW